MDQNAAALNVAKEVMAKTDALGSSLDQARDICHNKAGSAV